VEELNARQKAYVDAKTPEEKTRLAGIIKDLIERIIAAANELKEDLRTNRYVSVPGFTIGIGVPPTFNFDLDFVFK
jgi:hypothetical protein